MDINPDQWIVEVNSGADGGVNDKLHPLRIAANQSVKLQNIDTSIPGERRRRPATSLTATGIPFGPIKGLGVWVGGSGRVNDEVKLVAVAPGTTAPNAGNAEDLVFEWTGNGLWATVGVLTGHTSANSYVIESGVDLDGSADPSRVVFIPDVANDADNFYYDGTNLATCHHGAQNNPPRYGGFDVFNGRGFGIGNTRQRVIYSDIGEFTSTNASDGAFTDPTTRLFDFSSSGASPIQALKGFRQNEVLVYMKDSISELIIREIPDNQATTTGFVDPKFSWAKRTITRTYGTESPYAIATAGQDQLFLDQHGHVRSVARTDGDEQAGISSLPLSDSLQGTVDRVQLSKLANASAAAFDRFFYVAYPTGTATVPDEIWRYDGTTQAWNGPWTGENPLYFREATLVDGSAPEKTKSPTLFFSTSATWGEVRYFDDADAAPEADMVYEEVTRRHDFGDYSRGKAWQRIEVHAVATSEATMAIWANVDAKGEKFVGYLPVLGDVPQMDEELPFTLGGSGIVNGKFSLEDLDRGRDIQFRMTCTTDQQVQVLGYRVWASPLNVDHEVEDGS